MTRCAALLGVTVPTTPAWAPLAGLGGGFWFHVPEPAPPFKGCRLGSGS